MRLFRQGTAPPQGAAADAEQLSDVCGGGSCSGRGCVRSGLRVLSGARAALLGVVVLAPEAAAWQGLLGLARSSLGMSGGWEYLVPLLFGAAAFYVALLAQRYVLRGDSALTERALTWLYAAAGAAFNFWHASSVLGETASALFFGGASLSAALLWDRTLRAWRRDQLRAVGALERPLPRFRVLRWVLAGPSTFRAFRAAVVHGVTSPAEALAVAAAGVRPAGVAQGAERGAESSAVSAVGSAVGGQVAAVREVSVSRRSSLAELAQVSGKAAAVREAWQMVGVAPVGAAVRRDVEQVVELLAGEGIDVTDKYVREVRRRVRLRHASSSVRPRVELVKAVTA